MYNNHERAIARLVFAGLISAASVASQTIDRKGIREMTSDDKLILEQLAHVEHSGSLKGMTIEIWSGGGQPPPYYKSDQLRLMPSNGQDFIEFASLRFDSHFDPPSVQDKWTLPADPARVREAAHLILSLKMFESVFPEERNPGLADILSYEFLFSLGKVQVSRRYYRKMPELLEPLQSFAAQLTKAVRTSGRPTVFHNGREVKP
jgi:hypothetical protein